MTSAADQLSLPGYRAGTWAVDRDRSRVGFAIRQMFTPVRGRFTGYDALIVTGQRPLESTLDVSIDIASIDTGNARRDEHLRRSYLDLTANPYATYRSGSLRPTDQGLLVDGVLTLNDVTEPVPLALAPRGFFTDAEGTRAEFAATTRIGRRDFRVAAPMAAWGAVVSDTITIDLDIHAVLTG
ncbi:MAG: YceI family protein [Nocardioides sp.]